MIYCNKRAELLLGFSEGEILDKRIDELLPREVIPARHDDLEELVHDSPAQESKKRQQVELSCKDGRKIPVRVKLSKVQVDSEWIGAAVLQDLSEILEREKRLEGAMKEIASVNERLQELDKTRREFLGFAAHDLRTPLHKLSLSVELLRNPDLPKDQREKFLSVVERSAETMLQLVNDLLSITKIESGKLELKHEKVILKPYLEDLSELNRYLAERKHIDISVEFGGEPVDAVFDPKRISQVVNNLLSNAIKFSKENTQVTVSVSRAGEALRFSVQDQGLGIPEDDIEKLFDPFGKYSNQPTGGEQSTGLGLAICKKIVSLHGGRIWVESEFGKGSTFFFEIPYRGSVEFR